MIYEDDMFKCILCLEFKNIYAVDHLSNKSTSLKKAKGIRIDEFGGRLFFGSEVS